MNENFKNQTNLKLKDQTRDKFRIPFFMVSYFRLMHIRGFLERSSLLRPDDPNDGEGINYKKAVDSRRTAYK